MLVLHDPSDQLNGLSRLWIPQPCILFLRLGVPSVWFPTHGFGQGAELVRRVLDVSGAHLHYNHSLNEWGDLIARYG